MRHTKFLLLVLAFQLLSCSQTASNEQAVVEVDSIEESTEVEVTEEEKAAEMEEEMMEEEPPMDLDSTELVICTTKGGKANETGLKTWCWGDVALPEYTGSTGVTFSNKELQIASECGVQQVTNDGDRLKFHLNPKNPGVEDWCTRDFNMRAEFSTMPWGVNNPVGTEEWFGWSYEFGEDYVIDENNEWLFFQVHPGITNVSPHTELFINKKGQYSDEAGEIFVINNANNRDRHSTGITPKAGDKFNIVVHAVWDYAPKGLLQVWINDTIVYDKQVATIFPEYPWSGNAKWGIYKWPWAKAEGVEKSQQQGITAVETYMGALRMITRMPGDADYGTDAFEVVAPN